MESRKQKAEGRTAVVLMLVLLLLACETKEHADAELGALKKAKDAAAKVSARANTSEAQEIGVPECDAYIRSYEACLAEKAPEEQRASLRQTLNDQRRKWQDAIAGGTDQAAVAEQCKSAAAAATEKMTAYGCAF